MPQENLQTLTGSNHSKMEIKEEIKLKTKETKSRTPVFTRNTSASISSRSEKEQE